MYTIENILLQVYKWALANLMATYNEIASHSHRVEILLLETSTKTRISSTSSMELHSVQYRLFLQRPLAHKGKPKGTYTCNLRVYNRDFDLTEVQYRRN